MYEIRGKIFLLLVLILTAILGLVRAYPAKNQKNSKVRRGIFIEQVKLQTDLSDAHKRLDTPQQRKKVRSVLSKHHHRRQWSQHRPALASPKPMAEETKPFVLDLKNFPDLANANLGFQNPNIQVTIEVVDNPQMEVEMDLAKEGRNYWSQSSIDWLGNKKLFWPLFWEYPDMGRDDSVHTSQEDTPEDDSLEYNSEVSVLSGVVGDWGSRWSQGLDNYEYEEEEEWSSWLPCSTTCGHGNQKRIQSCGYACTATESRTCDYVQCPDDLNAVTDLMPYEAENDTRLFTADVDSCEQWLNCKNDFLQRYLHQVLTELPSCPCSYPSEVVYSAVTIHDEKLKKEYRWRDASGPRERLDIYKPTAHSCVRSMLSLDSTTLAAQHCCYDQHMELITRGKGAGAPNLISTEFSPELHFKVDVLPWILCKGDWSRFHAFRPPNNGLRCAENPQQDIYMNELEEAREY